MTDVTQTEQVEPSRPPVDPELVERLLEGAGEGELLGLTGCWPI